MLVLSYEQLWPENGAVIILTETTAVTETQKGARNVQFDEQHTDRDIVRQQFVPPNQTNYAHWCCDTFGRVSQDIRRRRPQLWRTINWPLHQDNVPAHTVYATQEFSTVLGHCGRVVEVVREDDLEKAFERWQNWWGRCINAGSDNFEGDRSQNLSWLINKNLSPVSFWWHLVLG